MKVSNFFYLFITSISGHLFLLLIGSIYFHFSKPIVIGSSKSHIVSSYLSQDNFFPSSLMREEFSIKEKHLPKKIDVSKQSASVAKRSSTVVLLHPAHSFKREHKAVGAQQKLTSATRMIRKGESSSELLFLLHATIQRHQHYPTSARQMEREGRVTLKFLLYTDGTINHLRIAKSSGTLSLDDAAIAAVQNAAPFAKVQEYLTIPREYKIDIVFELT